MKNKSIYKLFNAVREHPDFVAGTIFTKDDIPEGKSLPPVWKSRWVEDPMIDAGNVVLENFYCGDDDEDQNSKER